MSKKHKVDGVVTSENADGSLEVEMNNGEKGTVPASEIVSSEKKGPPTIAESEVAQHAQKASGDRAKEIARRMEMDPDKKQSDVEKEYDAKVKEQAKIDSGKSAAHSATPGTPVSKL